MRRVGSLVSAVVALTFLVPVGAGGQEVVPDDRGNRLDRVDAADLSPPVALVDEPHPAWGVVADRVVRVGSGSFTPAVSGASWDQYSHWRWATAGCGGGNYCPDNPVTRGQMAVFLAKALGLHWPN